MRCRRCGKHHGTCKNGCCYRCICGSAVLTDPCGSGLLKPERQRASEEYQAWLRRLQAEQVEAGPHLWFSLS